MNFELFGKLVLEYLQNNPIDHSETFYESDECHQQGRNDVKEYLVKFLNEAKQ